MEINSTSRKEFFNSIREIDNTKLKTIISKNRNFIYLSRNVYPYTTIQLAIHYHNYEAFDILIDNGFDVTKVIPNKKYNGNWAPIFFTALRIAIFGAYPIQNEAVKFEKAIKILEKILKLGCSEINLPDEYGINCVERAYHTTREVLTQPDLEKEDPVFIERINQIFKLIIDNGADLNFKSKLGSTFLELVKQNNFEKYLNQNIS